MARIGDFVSAVAPVTPEAFGDVIIDRFQAEPNTLVIAVVDAETRPVGIIERNAFTLKMAAEYGRALYARRPATSFMDPAPRTFEADTDAEVLFDNLDAEDLGGLFNGFVVTSSGRYIGVGAGVHILRAGAAISRRRAEAMSVLTEDLVRAEREARASSRAKSEFLAVMSHEIRTPLNGVLGVASLMERELKQADMRPYVETILASGQNLLRLLTDALDMSRAESGLMSLENGPVDLVAVAQDLEQLWTARAQEKDLDLRVACDVGDHRWVLADEMRLKQLFNNLIGNALKFTQAGSVAVAITAEGRDDAVWITAFVDDSGPGISPEVAVSIFEPFNTGQAGREGAGAGLGLAICRQIVERMEGRIETTTAPQGGARFHFELRLPSAEPAADGAEQTIPGPTHHETLHVLIADDNATNRFVATQVLAMFGCTSETVENGHEAVERVQLAPFDLVLMDIKMPVMDGVAATRAIRALDHSASRLPILALTANADTRDAVGYLAAGMDGVVQKPIQPDALLSAIRRALTQTDVAAAA